MILLWIYRFITPVVFIWGGLVLCSGEYGDNDLWIGAILAVVGFLFGYVTWILDLAPRMFWVKSPFALFQSRIVTALESAMIFFLIPCFITGVEMLVDNF